MYMVILTALVGLGVGRLLRHWRPLRHVDTTLMLTVNLMLFVLGLSVGSNRAVLDSLPRLGGEAAVVAVLATLGSALAAWGLHRWQLHSKRRSDER